MRPGGAINRCDKLDGGGTGGLDKPFPRSFVGAGGGEKDGDGIGGLNKPGGERR